MGQSNPTLVGSRTVVLGDKMNLPKLTDIDIANKKVILRLDLDTPDNDTSRIEASLPTINYLLEKNCKLVIIGHKGRPEGVDESLSLKSLVPILQNLIGKPVSFEGDGEITLKENLRFDKGEEANDAEYVKKIASWGEFFVNEAFASSHREHTSIVGIPKFLPHAAGLRFAQEVENLSKVLNNSEKPKVAIISGLKEDKLTYIDPFRKFADKILIGGRLPEFIKDEDPLWKDTQVSIARLLPDKEDITIRSIENFENEVKNARMVVVSGPIGKFEEEGHRQGTQRVFTAVSQSSAFKIAGGGDTEAALNLLNLKDKFDWVSVGGGAMLEFLAKGTLPGIQALLE